MDNTFWLGVDCPYCGERFDTMVDASAGDVDYIEDCAVCCRPIEMHLRVDEENEDVTLRAGRDD
jgi:hypothetical protein